MTSEEKEQTLKAFVEKAHNNGFLNYIKKPDIEIGSNYLIIYDDKGAYRLSVEIFSIPDLICNADAMRAVYGDELACVKCGIIKRENLIDRDWVSDTDTCLNRYNGELCYNDIWQPAYQYHQQQLVILDDDARLEYIKRTIG